MSLKTLTFFALLAVTMTVALTSTVPEKISYDDDISNSEWVFGDVVPVSDDVVLVRKARSPQDSSVSGTFQHSRQDGSSVNFDYNRQIGRNMEVYAGAGRNFRYNDNNAHAGLRYRF